MRAFLVALLVVDLAAAGALFVADAAAGRATCTPDAGPAPQALRVLTQPDDGCGWVAARRSLHVQAWSMVAAAVAPAVALGWRHRWRFVGIAPVLVALVHLLPVALFSLLWVSDCGPVETYVRECTSFRWLTLPWATLAVANVVAVVIDARRRRAPPSPPP